MLLAVPLQADIMFAQGKLTQAGNV